MWKKIIWLILNKICRFHLKVSSCVSSWPSLQGFFFFFFLSRYIIPPCIDSGLMISGCWTRDKWKYVDVSFIRCRINVYNFFLLSFFFFFFLHFTTMSTWKSIPGIVWHKKRQYIYLKNIIPLWELMEMTKKNDKLN